MTAHTQASPEMKRDPQEEAPPAPAPPAAPRAPAPRRASSLGMRLGTIGQIFRMQRSGGRRWLLPMMVLLAALGLVLSGLQAIQYLAPFIYAIF